MLKNALLFLLLLAAYCLNGQQFVADTTAKRLGVKTAVWKTTFPKKPKDEKSEAETYTTAGKIITKAKANWDGIFYDTTAYTYNSIGQLILYVNKRIFIRNTTFDTATFAYNADGLLNEHTFRYDDGELYRSKLVYFTTKNYISAVEEYEVSDSGKVWGVSSCSFNQYGDTIEIGSYEGTYYKNDLEYNKQGKLVRKTIWYSTRKDPSYVTYVYNTNGQPIEQKYWNCLSGDKISTYTYNDKGLLEKIDYTSKSIDKTEFILVSTTIFTYSFY